MGVRHKIVEYKGQYRVTLPKFLVERLGWKKGDVVEFYVRGGKFIMLGRERVGEYGKGSKEAGSAGSD